MRSLMLRRRNRRKGQALMEYVAVVGLVIIVAATSVAFFGGKLATAFHKMGESVTIMWNAGANPPTGDKPTPIKFPPMD